MKLNREEIAEYVANKKYPDLNDKKVKQAREEGVLQFEKFCEGREYPAILAGRELYARPEVSTYTTNNPNRPKQIIGRFQHYDPVRMPIHELMPKVFAAGHQFYETTSVEKRIELCYNIHQVVKENYWVRCVAKERECGQSRMEQIGETDEAVDFPLLIGLYLQELHEEKLMPTPAFAGDANGKAFVPHGVFVNIEPFNFPDAIPLCMATMALAMGNAVVLKASGYSSLNGYLVYETLCEAFARTGIPYNRVINFMPGPGATMADALLASPFTTGFSFTGSTHAYDEIIEKHGKLLRYSYGGRARLVAGAAETSGVNPFVVWKDANVLQAAKEYVKSFIGRSGQKCSSARVALVHRDVFSEFIAVARMELVVVTYGSVEEGADLGAVISEKAALGIKQAIASLIEKEAVVVEYEKQIAAKLTAQDILPTLLRAKDFVLSPENQPLRELLMNTEIFGPVSTIVKVNDLHDIEMLLQESRFALTGSVFTDDVDIAKYVLRILPAGNKYWNRKCTGALVDCEAFGGLLSASSPHGMKGKYALLRYASMPIVSARLSGLDETAAQNMLSELHFNMTKMPKKAPEVVNPFLQACLFAKQKTI